MNAALLVIGFVVWGAFAVWVGMVLGRVLRGRDRQVPSPPSTDNEGDES